MTFRLPISDARWFSSDPSVAETVALPRDWAAGGFVRGFGPIVRRPAGAVEPWSFESAFADLGRTVLFDNRSIESFNRAFAQFTVRKIRKRAWMALRDSNALFDVDVSLQLGQTGDRRSVYSRGGSFSLEEVGRVVANAAALPVELRSHSPAHDRERLMRIGVPLARRFVAQTSPREAMPTPLVCAGRTAVVVEMSGLSPSDLNVVDVEHLHIDGIDLASFDVVAHGGGSLRCHVLWDAEGSRRNRKRIRELRIHILRLHSIYELIRFLASSAITSHKASISDVVGSAGFDALQRTLLSCLRIVRAPVHPGGADSKTVLDTAFSAHNFIDRDLNSILDRTLSAMRPKVRDEVLRYYEAENARLRENEEARLARSDSTRPPLIVIGDLHMSTYEFNDSNIGAVGDHAVAHDNVIGNTADRVAVGGLALSRSELVSALGSLQSQLAEREDGESAEALVALQSAQAELKSGNDKAAIASLRRAGKWALAAATSVGGGVAATAISAALGLG